MRFAVYELHRRPVGFGIWDDNAVVQYFVTGENIGVKGVAAEALVAAVKAVADNNLSIMDNITLAPVKLKLQSREEASENALKLLERVGLKEKSADMRFVHVHLSAVVMLQIAVVRNFAPSVFGLQRVEQRRDDSKRFLYIDVVFD